MMTSFEHKIEHKIEHKNELSSAERTLDLLVFEQSVLNQSASLTEVLRRSHKNAFLVLPQEFEENGVYGFVDNPVRTNRSLSETLSHQFNVNPRCCVVVATSQAALELASHSRIPVILFNVDVQHRVEYQKKYKPLYVCDTEEELAVFVKLYGAAKLSDIEEINKDLVQPMLDARNLKPKEQEELGKTLFPVYDVMMQGRDLNSFTSQFTDSRPTFIEVMMFVNKLGKHVGFIMAAGHEIDYPPHTLAGRHSFHKYTVCEVLVCMLPEIQNNRYLEAGILTLLDEYHLKNPDRGIIIFDSMVNYKSYKVAVKASNFGIASAFPGPGCMPNPRVERFMQDLKYYFNYKPASSDPYVVRTISDIRIKEFPTTTEDDAWNFYYNKTGNQRNVGLLALSCYYVVDNNSLDLPAQSKFSYDEYFGDQDSKSLAKREQRKQRASLESQQRRHLGKLFLLSTVLKKEVSNLTPLLWDLPRLDMNRTSILWNYYFNRGVFLSAGGAAESFIKSDWFTENKNLTGFNKYRSDRSESFEIKENDIKNFLLQENALTESAQLNDLRFSFSLGSHEGAMRVARCIYDTEKNNGIFCMLGSYGFLAASAAVMKPVPYNVRLVNIDRNNGEKIVLSDLERLVRKFPGTKTLFLELKTTCGAVYTEHEIKKIVSFCKKHGIFILADAAHINMHYYQGAELPDIVGICLELNFHDFAVVYTGSKTYGLERARVGFVVTSRHASIPDFWVKMEIDFYRVNGSMGDTPYEVTRVLFNSPVEARRNFCVNAALTLQYNMNLMMAYIEGVDSPNIDPHLRQAITDEILPEYRGGMPGVTVVYKPHGGVQLKVNMSGLQHKFLGNIRMSSSEIFGYALNKMAHVVTLNSYQIMDPEGFGMRLAYSIKHDVHQGMMAMHDFIQTLSNYPSYNPFMSGYNTLEEMIASHHAGVKNVALQHPQLKSYSWNPSLFSDYKNNVRKKTPRHVKLSEETLDQAVTEAAKTIQRHWRSYLKSKSTEHQKKTVLESTAKLKAKL